MNQSQGIVTTLDLSSSSNSTDGMSHDIWNGHDELSASQDVDTESLDENQSLVDIEC